MSVWQKIQHRGSADDAKETILVLSGSYCCIFNYLNTEISDLYLRWHGEEGFLPPYYNNNCAIVYIVNVSSSIVFFLGIYSFKFNVQLGSQKEMYILSIVLILFSLPLSIFSFDILIKLFLLNKKKSVILQ